MAGEGPDGGAGRHKDAAAADGDEHPPRVDEPLRRQGERQERQHEHHGQHPNGEPVHAVVRLGRGEDRGVADPEGLHHEVHVHRTPRAPRSGRGGGRGGLGCHYGVRLTRSACREMPQRLTLIPIKRIGTTHYSTLARKILI